jgi:hypothetical protein
VLNSWQERINKAKAEIPDWEDTIASATELKVGDIVRDVIIESEFGPQILYHLASTDEEVAKINAMPAKDALRYIGRLEARYEAAAEAPEKVAPAKVEAKPRVKPPPPITPIKSGSSPVNEVYEPGEFKGTFQEYKAKRLAGKV